MNSIPTLLCPTDFSIRTSARRAPHAKPNRLSDKAIRRIYVIQYIRYKATLQSGFLTRKHAVPGAVGSQGPATNVSSGHHRSWAVLSRGCARWFDRLAVGTNRLLPCVLTTQSTHSDRRGLASIGWLSKIVVWLCAAVGTCARRPSRTRPSGESRTLESRGNALFWRVSMPIRRYQASDSHH
jgi:hypothetical protein